MFASHSDRHVPDHNRNLQKFDLKKYVVLKACLNGGRGPQVGEVTRLAVDEKENAFTCNPITPRCWCEVS